MKICSNLRTGRLSAVIAGVAGALLLTGCSLTEDSSLGYDIVPNHQKMVMRHLTFKGGKVISFDVANSTAERSEYTERPAASGNFFETSLYRTDSLISYNITYGYMGVERSDTFGLRSAAFATSMIYGNSLPDTAAGFGYMPIFDTMALHISVDAYCGDTLVPIKYNVYELTKPLLGSVIASADTTAYVNCDLTQAYDASKPLFSFTFPDGEKTGPATSTINLTPTDMSATGATWDFVRRLMLIPEDRSSWDGYANKEKSVYEKEEDFAKKFYGVCIVPDEASLPADKRGGLFSTQLSLSGLTLQGRSRNPQDPTLIKDTVGMTYYFDNSLSEKNWSVNNIRHDYSCATAPLTGGKALKDIAMDAHNGSGKIDRAERDKVQVGIVEGLAGPLTELYFTDDFIDELHNLAVQTDADGNGYSVVGINQALICFYLTNADYDWMTTQGNAAAITPYLNSSLDRLGMYTNFNSLTSIADYDYLSESTASMTLTYDGYLNRSRACYVMDISQYMQSLVNYARTLTKDGDGKYTFKEEDEGYVPRTIYLGPEATGPYAFRRSLLQGMEGSENAAPIHVELTYTLFK